MLEYQMSYCRPLRGLLERGRRVAGLYAKIVEPVMGHPRHMEHLASYTAGPATCEHECLVLAELSGLIEGSSVCIYGPGASVLETRGCDVVGASDGSIHSLVENGVRADYLTTDLDPGLRLLASIGYAARYLLIHVHGDNVEAVRRAESLAPPARIVYTTQAEPIGCVFNLGGYTDGDRAVIAALVMNAREVAVEGYPAIPVHPHKDHGGAYKGKEVKVGLARALIEEAASSLGFRLLRLGGDSMKIYRL